MRKPLIILAVFYTLLLSLNFIIGTFQTPRGYLFMGVVHHPNDYFYYLSQFAQGKTRWVTSVDTYTTEKTAPTLVGMTNVLAGRILSVAGIPAAAAYQITLTLYTFLFFLLVIFFLEQIFPGDTPAQLVTFLLFGIANTFPWSGSFFANVTEPLVRFPRVPHQMLGLVCTVMPMIIVTKWQSKSLLLKTKIILVFFTVLSGVVLSNINPVQWALVIFVLFASYLLILITHRMSWHMTYSELLIPLVFAAAGLPMVIYLRNIFTALPFTQVAMWESWQQIPVPPQQFFESFGPVLLLSAIGIPLYVKRSAGPKMIILLYTIFSVLLFLSPVSKWAHITNVRFLSAVTVLGECVLAAYCIVRMPVKKRQTKNLIVWSLVTGLAILCIPVTVRQFRAKANLDTKNSYTYLAPGAVEAYRAVRELTKPDDVILATWPYDASLPALTDRTGFIGHPLLTINADIKNGFAYQFFDGRISDPELVKQLRQFGIAYVLEFTGVEKVHKPFLIPVFRNPLLTLYRVSP